MSNIIDAYSVSKKHEVMNDTWGHLYPKPKYKYPGYMTIAIGEYGDNIIVNSRFDNLPCSPQRCSLEHRIFTLRCTKNLSPGVYRVTCSLWFFKTSDDMYLGEPIGRLIKIKITQLIR